MKLPKPSLGWLVPILAVLAGISLYLVDPLPLQVLRNNVFDHYQRWDARPYQDAPVRVIDIDDESLAKLGQWPWPRTLLADLTQRLQSAGAAAIAFDVIFAEPDRTSPTAMLHTWKLPPGLRQALSALPDHDAVLAQTIAGGSVVLGHAPEHGGRAPSHFARPFSFTTEGPSPLPFLHAFEGTVAALPALQDAAAGNGALSFIPDSDGIIRRVPLVLRMGDEIVPALVAEVLRVSQAEPGYTLITSPEAGVGLEAVHAGALPLPVTAEGEMWVRYTQGGDARTLPAWKVLAGEVPAASLRGQILLVGSSAKGLQDLRFSPLGGIIPGVEVHALALEQILVGEPLARPNWATGFEVLVILLGGLLVGAVALSAGALLSAGLVVALLAGIVWGGWIAFARYDLLLDPLTPGLTLLGVFILASLQHHLASERRQRWVKQAFARYVSPNLVAHLVDHPGELELGGSRRECSFIFTDLAGFTSLMEKLDPAEAVSLLNTYLDNMIRIAFEHEGTLDRIVGDAVAIMFSAPVEQADHRQRALRCAEDMHRYASRYAAEANARGVPFGVTRIGIHTGEVTIGNFGGSTIFDYRALGDPVNTAARLESVNKQLGTLVCVSEATLSGCRGVAARPIGKLVLKGKTQPLMVYEPWFAASEKAVPLRPYQTAYDLMAARDPDAHEMFEMLLKERPDDGLVNFQLKRLQAGQQGDVIVFTEK
jgi:adenylate cyclase